MKEAAVFVKNHELKECDLIITICKKRDAFNILLISTNAKSGSQ
jgi:hypothetical protein